MNDTGTQALKLINALLDDFQDPDFVWQIVALLVSLGVAWFIANWWKSTQASAHVRLQQASRRLVFPLVGMLLTGVAQLVLKPFFSITLLKLAMPLLGSMALVRSVVFVLRQTFPGAGWLTVWEKAIAMLVWSWLALHITDLAPYFIDTLEQFEFALGKQKLNLWLILSAVATVFLTVVFALWIGGVIEARLMRMRTLDGNLRIVGVRVAKAILTVIALIASLSLLGINMTALSVFTGALGVGLGFGLQKIASNYVSGFIILLDRSIRIGNIVQVGNDVGEVTQITTRYTVLKHPGGTEFIVPNETLIGTTVQNQTYSDSRFRLVTQVGVAYDSDLELAMRLIVDVARATERVLLDPDPKVFITQFAESSINLELGFWIADLENGKMGVVSEINLGIWKAFKLHGIEIPLPQRELRVLNYPAKDAESPL